ncbi:29872_t:CDS:1, partial [Gigaspora margarita]
IFDNDGKFANPDFIRTFIQNNRKHVICQQKNYLTISIALQIILEILCKEQFPVQAAFQSDNH